MILHNNIPLKVAKILEFLEFFQSNHFTSTSSLFWDITLPSLWKVCWRLLGMLAACLILVPCLAFLRPWRWRWHIPPKRWLTFRGLHCIISQNLRTYILTSCPIRLENGTEYKKPNRITSAWPCYFTRFCYSENISPYWWMVLLLMFMCSVSTIVV
jgi:hypothetical protein